MTLQTTKELVISPGLFDQTSGDIKLLPTFEGETNNLALANSPLSTMDTEVLSVAEISKNVQVGQNFFYSVEKYNSEKGALFDIEYSELGIGELRSEYGEYYLAREVVFEQNTLEDGLHYPLPNNFLAFEPDDYLSVSTYIPTDFIQLCAQEHSVLCTTETYVATPIELSTYTVLGRADGNIEALESSEIHKILGYTDEDPTANVTWATSVPTAVKNYTEPLILATNLLELTGDNSKVVCNQLHLRSRVDRPTTRTKGYLIFNDNTKSFEAYDGTGWRRLAWEGESSDPEDTQMLTYTWDGDSWNPISK